MQHVGKWLIVMGGCIFLLGIAVLVLERFGLFHLPGDLRFESKHWKFYFPLASCLILSLVLTLILWLISYFRR